MRNGTTTCRIETDYSFVYLAALNMVVYGPHPFHSSSVLHLRHDGELCNIVGQPQDGVETRVGWHIGKMVDPPHMMDICRLVTGLAGGEQ